MTGPAIAAVATSANATPAITRTVGPVDLRVLSHRLILRPERPIDRQIDLAVEGR
jgi:hypothetical protein